MSASSLLESLDFTPNDTLNEIFRKSANYPPKSIFHRQKLLKSNLVETLVWADLYRCETLKTECLRKFQEWRQRISTEELKPLKKYPELMFEMLSFGGK